MMRTLLASVATIGLTMGAAIGQELPPATGLTPGAPLASDPYSGEGVTAGETGPGDQAFVGTAADPMAEPFPGEPILAEPFPAEPVGIAQAPIAAEPPVALAYPDYPSSAGLTPGAPLGSDPYSDQKAVAGDDLRTTGAGLLFR